MRRAGRSRRNVVAGLLACAVALGACTSGSDEPDGDESTTEVAGAADVAVDFCTEFTCDLAATEVDVEQVRSTLVDLDGVEGVDLVRASTFASAAADALRVSDRDVAAFGPRIQLRLSGGTTAQDVRDAVGEVTGVLDVVALLQGDEREAALEQLQAGIGPYCPACTADVVAFVCSGADCAEQAQGQRSVVEAAMSGDDRIATFVYVSQQEALDRLRATSDAPQLAQLQADALPASYDIRLADGVEPAEVVSDLQRLLGLQLVVPQRQGEVADDARAQFRLLRSVVVVSG